MKQAGPIFVRVFCVLLFVAFSCVSARYNDDLLRRSSRKVDLAVLEKLLEEFELDEENLDRQVGTGLQKKRSLRDEDEGEEEEAEDVFIKQRLQRKVDKRVEEEKRETSKVEAKETQDKRTSEKVEERTAKSDKEENNKVDKEESKKVVQGDQEEKKAKKVFGLKEEQQKRTQKEEENTEDLEEFEEYIDDLSKKIGKRVIELYLQQRVQQKRQLQQRNFYSRLQSQGRGGLYERFY